MLLSGEVRYVFYGYLVGRVRQKLSCLNTATALVKSAMSTRDYNGSCHEEEREKKKPENQAIRQHTVRSEKQDKTGFAPRGKKLESVRVAILSKCAGV